MENNLHDLESDDELIYRTDYSGQSVRNTKRFKEWINKLKQKSNIFIINYCKSCNVYFCSNPKESKKCISCQSDNTSRKFTRNYNEFKEKEKDKKKTKNKKATNHFILLFVSICILVGKWVYYFIIIEDFNIFEIFYLTISGINIIIFCIIYPFFDWGLFWLSLYELISEIALFIYATVTIILNDDEVFYTALSYAFYCLCVIIVVFYFVTIHYKRI